MPGTAVAAAAGAGAGGAGGQQERPGLGTQPRQEYNLVNKGILPIKTSNTFSVADQDPGSGA